MLIQLPLIGKVHIEFYEEGLREFTARQFSNYVLENENVEKFQEAFVKMRIEKCAIPNVSDMSAMQLSRNFKIKGNEIKYDNKKIRFEQDGQIYITISEGYKETRWVALKRGITKRTKEAKYARYHRLFYNTVLFPLYLVYNLLDSFYLLHGSLLGYKDKYFLICGLDGVGKSTMTTLLCDKGMTCYADNYVMFNGAEYMGINMALRMTPETKTDLKNIYEDKNLKEVVLEGTLDHKVKVDKVYLLYISDEKKVDKNVQCSPSRLLLFLNNASEISAANRYIGPCELLSSEKKQEDIDVNMLGIPKGALAEVCEELWNEISSLCR